MSKRQAILLIAAIAVITLTAILVAWWPEKSPELVVAATAAAAVEVARRSRQQVAAKAEDAKSKAVSNVLEMRKAETHMQNSVKETEGLLVEMSPEEKSDLGDDLLR